MSWLVFGGRKERKRTFLFSSPFFSPFFPLKTFLSVFELSLIRTSYEKTRQAHTETRRYESVKRGGKERREDSDGLNTETHTEFDVN